MIASPPFLELRAGNLGVRIATHPDEVDAVQSLRYRVFYGEMGARADVATTRDKRDRDAYDAIADHLLVVDHEIGPGPEGVVGTYRLIRREAAAKIGQFYSADEYDIGKIENIPGGLLELGRSCVDAEYRNRAVMQLLWGGIAAYVFHYKIDLMFGCASLPGIDPDALATELAYLWYYHLAPPPLRVRALPHRYIEMRRLDREEIDPKRALAALPPLIKGYLRLGGFVGDGAVIDAQFNTTDVAVVVKTDMVTESYYRHYERRVRDTPTEPRRMIPRWLTEARGLRADLIALAAGALAALALPPLHVLPVLLVAFPVLLTLVNAAGRPVLALRRGWWFGFGYHLIGLYWITEAILFEAARFWWLVPLAVPALAAVLAVFVAVPVGIAWFAATGSPQEARQREAGSAQIMVLAGGWVLGDLARQFVATGFPWNPLGGIWGVPGWFGDVMLQPAALVSVHGLTLATVAIACAPLLRWRGRALCLGVFLAWIGYGVVRMAAPAPPDQKLRVVLVQGNVAQGQKWDPALRDGVFEKYLRLTDDGTRAEGAVPHLAVWPETASPYLLDANAREAIAASGHGGTVLAGAVRFDESDRPRNTLTAVSPTGAVSGLYDKWHLVPFGEYQPSWAQVGIQLVPGGGFARGPGPETLRLPGIPPVGPLICYEAIFPGQVVDEADRPDWMANVTNDAWFGTSAGPRQHLAAARLRAVEEGLPLLRAANTGISVAFDARGHEIARIGMEETGIRTVTLPGPLPRTIFARVGLLIPAALATSALIGGLFRRGRRRTG